MSKILVITPQMPFPPEQGTSLRNLNILRGLVGRHDVSVLTFKSQEMKESPPLPDELATVHFDQVPEPPSRSRLNRLLSMIRSDRPDMSLRLRSSDLESRLSNLLTTETELRNPYDIVQIEGIELVHLLPIIRNRSPDSKVVFDQHNAETLLQQRLYEADKLNIRRLPSSLYSRVQFGRLRRYERWACENADWVTVVSQSDQQHLMQLVPGIQSSVIPNCIDVEKYRLTSSSVQIPLDLLFIGKMDYRPNIDGVLWFAQTIWPKIRQVRPETTWAIVGQKPVARIRRLNGLEGVTVTGYVDDVTPYIAGTKIFTLPFRVGSGARLKLLEAMAAGKAIVSTSIGAEGYKFENGREVLIADNASEFADTVLKLLEEPAQRARLGQLSQQAVERYDWRIVIPKFDEVYRRLIKQ